MVNEHLAKPVYSDLNMEGDILARDLFRTEFANTVIEPGMDVCLITAINNLCGQPIYPTVESMLWREVSHDNQAGKMKVLRSFVENRGFYLDESVPFVPYHSRGKTDFLCLGRRCTFTVEELAECKWSLAVFSRLLSEKSRSTHALLRLDRTPLAGEGVLVSHVVAVRYSNYLNRW